METRVLAEARVEAQRSLNAAVSALAADGDLLDASERAAIDEAMTALETAIKGSDRDAVNAAVEALEAAALPFAEKRMDKGIREALAGHTVEEFET
jgi:molecular chaperone HscA